jgi:hypothetical protein
VCAEDDNRADVEQGSSHWICHDVLHCFDLCQLPSVYPLVLHEAGSAMDSRRN